MLVGAMEKALDPSIQRGLDACPFSIGGDGHESSYPNPLVGRSLGGVEGSVMVHTGRIEPSNGRRWIKKIKINRTPKGLQ